MVRGGNPTAAMAMSSHDGDIIRMAFIVVQDMTSATLQVGHTTISLASTASVRTLVQQVATSANYMNGTFQLQLQPVGSDSGPVSVSNSLT